MGISIDGHVWFGTPSCEYSDENDGLYDLIDELNGVEQGFAGAYSTTHIYISESELHAYWGSEPLDPAHFNRTPEQIKDWTDKIMVAVEKTGLGLEEDDDYKVIPFKREDIGWHFGACSG